MRKISSRIARIWAIAAIGAFFVLGWGFVAYSDVNVMVSAIVGSPSNPPQVLGVDPNSDPIVLQGGSIQTFAVQIQDLDSPSVTYTITSGTGANNPVSGTYSNTSLLASGQAYVYFTYFAPQSKAGSSNITITLNDGTAVVVRNIGIYVY